MQHLSGVIEDALDLARLENNKFTLFKSKYNLRGVLHEIKQVLSLQMSQKGIGFDVAVENGVPEEMFSD